MPDRWNISDYTWRPTGKEYCSHVTDEQCRLGDPDQILSPDQLVPGQKYLRSSLIASFKPQHLTYRRPHDEQQGWFEHYDVSADTLAILHKPYYARLWHYSSLGLLPLDNKWIRVCLVKA